MDPFARRRWIAGGVFTVGAIALSIWLASSTRVPGPADEQPQFGKRGAGNAPPPASSSPYLNTAAQVKYVGNAVCIDCHRDEHETYLKTAHSRALAPVDPASEPAFVRYFHGKSRRHYEVVTKDGVVRHREMFHDGGSDLVLNDRPIRYVIGSGHHSQSYLMEIDGFLVESPVTFYSSTKTWRMSPGYDRPVHQGFTRAAGLGCIACHAGRVDAIGNSVNRLRIHEQVIGCENCHGPGSLHVKRRNAETEAFRGLDNTIVNPARLSRTLRESVCSQCHLRGAATVIVRGRNITDFRPGLPLTDVQIDYRIASDDGSMTVTGHVEQMRQSKCYINSETMTCTTCHNPHSRPEPAARIEHYRTKCQNCHDPANDDCKLEKSRRLARSPQNDCVQCHMPKSSTDIPHFAFTHHRVGLNHKVEYRKPRLTGREKLVPVGDVSRFSRLDRLRNLGLAYLEFANLNPGPAAEGFYRRSEQLLREATAAGIRDADALAALARLAWDRKRDGAFELAKEAAAQKNCAGHSRVMALYIIGDTHLKQQRFDEAERIFEQLVKLRRFESDWLQLANCRKAKGDLPGAIQALQSAAKIRPDEPNIQRALAEAHRLHGDKAASRRHSERAERLLRFLAPSGKPPRNKPKRE